MLAFFKYFMSFILYIVELNQSREVEAERILGNLSCNIILQAFKFHSVEVKLKVH